MIEEVGPSSTENRESVSQEMEPEISLSQSSNIQESSQDVEKLLSLQIENLKSEIKQYSAKVSESQEKLHQVQLEIKKYQSKVLECQKKLDNIVKAQSLLNGTCIIENSNAQNVESPTGQPGTSTNHSAARMEQSTSQMEVAKSTQKNRNNFQDNENELDEASSQDPSDNTSLSSYRPTVSTQSTKSQSIEVNVQKFNLPWQIACQKLLHALRENKDSQHFREPVDEEDYPDYRKFVTTPMSLREIEGYFTIGDYYKSPIQLSKDVDLIFINSRKYNEDKHTKIYKQTTRLKKFYEDQMNQIISNWRASKKSKAGASKRKIIDDVDELDDSDTDDDSQRKLKRCRPKRRRRVLSDDDEPSTSKKRTSKKRNESDDEDVDEEDEYEPIRTRSKTLKEKKRNRIHDVDTSDQSEESVDETETDTEGDDDTEMSGDSSEDDQSSEDYDYRGYTDDDYNSESVDEEMENENAIPLTAANILDNFHHGDKVSVTGKVCKVFKTVNQPSARQGKEFKLFKFLLKIEDGRNVECAAWEKVADDCQLKIRRNQVIKVEDVHVKSCKGEIYNLGNFGFRLVLYTTSKMDILRDGSKNI